MSADSVGYGECSLGERCQQVQEAMVSVLWERDVSRLSSQQFTGREMSGDYTGYGKFSFGERCQHSVGFGKCSLGERCLLQTQQVMVNVN